ncbi:MAG: PEP-CTERM sorting domain-containing protein [Armatimonadetes bacterium]|nr:PEP-CTERM sorting domain-containing protein [Armatimonadota bacterium]
MKNRVVGTSASAFILGLALAQTSLAVGPIDFETAGDLANNFRLNTNTVNSSRLSQIGPSVDNDFIAHNNNPFNSSSTTVGIYDTSPGDVDATQSLFSGAFSVEFDISAVQTASSFGVVLINPDEINFRTDNLLALFNVDNSGTLDTIRFFRDGNSPFNNGSAGTLVGTAVNGDSGLNVSSDAAPVWGHFKMDYAVNAGVPQMTVTVGNFSATSAFDAAHALPSSVEVAFRIYDLSGDGSAKLDNFQITSVPEPTSAALIGLGLAAALLNYRRRCEA